MLIDSKRKGITTITLRKIITRLLFTDERNEQYVIPMQGSFMLPNMAEEESPESLIADWVAYRIMSVDPFVQSTVYDYDMEKQAKIKILIQAVGPHSEQMIRSTLFWETRLDAIHEFEEYNANMYNDPHSIKSFKFEQRGYGTNLGWKTIIALRTWIRISDYDEED